MVKEGKEKKNPAQPFGWTGLPSASALCNDTFRIAATFTRSLRSLLER